MLQIELFFVLALCLFMIVSLCLIIEDKLMHSSAACVEKEMSEDYSEINQKGVFSPDDDFYCFFHKNTLYG